MAKDSKLAAQSSLIKDRNIITQQEVEKALLPDCARLVVKPLAERLVNQQPDIEALTSLRQGAAYASELVRSLKSTQPQASQEKVQHSTRIKDTIHLLEGLCKGIKKELKTHPADGPDQQCYLELMTLLDSIESSIKTLEEKQSVHSTNCKDSDQ